MGSQLDLKEIRFRGIGSDDNVTLGELNMYLTIDGCTYSILVRIVSDKLLNYDMLIGADFFNTVETTIRADEISINSWSKKLFVDGNMPEIFQINFLFNNK